MYNITAREVNMKPEGQNQNHKMTNINMDVFCLKGIVDAVDTWTSQHVVYTIYHAIGRLDHVTLDLSLLVDDDRFCGRLLFQVQPLLGQCFEAVAEPRFETCRVHWVLQNVVLYELKNRRRNS